jgi:hypothetical protein
MGDFPFSHGNVHQRIAFKEKVIISAVNVPAHGLPAKLIQPAVGFFLALYLSFLQGLRKSFIHRAGRRKMILTAIVAFVYGNRPTARRKIEPGPRFNQYVFGDSLTCVHSLAAAAPLHKFTFYKNNKFSLEPKQRSPLAGMPSLPAFFKFALKKRSKFQSRVNLHPEITD